MRHLVHTLERLEEHTLVNSALQDEATECIAQIAEISNDWRQRALAAEKALQELEHHVLIAHGPHAPRGSPLCARCLSEAVLRDVVKQLGALKS